ncbi:MAG: BlaI/MecI/CopY family transcriptional regulator, partial [Pirellulales bacterium]|nr:BlaI/MecI/CopY family transcriptional regulator [Pirellulales bacterium]
KGLVVHEKLGRNFIYTPRYSRERATKRFLKQVFDGALDQVVVSLLRTTDLSTEELHQLEKIIASARRRKHRQDKTHKDH